MSRNKLAILLIFLMLNLAGCDIPPDLAFHSPAPTPAPRLMTPRPRASKLHLHTILGGAPTGEVWRTWPRYKFGVAGAALLADSVAWTKTARLMPFYGVANWGVSYTHAKRALDAGIVYFPRLQLRATFNPANAPDLDGVIGEHADLVSCTPTYNQEPEAKRIASAYPGTAWDLFNEPDNLDLTSGVGCWDTTVGGRGYTGFGSDPSMTGPRHAYRQAATVARYWIMLIRQHDAAARFTCCGELNGPLAAYVRGVADAYRELYGEPIPLAAVSLHIYQIENWDLQAYQALLQTAIANVDAHPDLRGLPIVINEGILLSRSLDEVNRQRTAWLLYHWMDWLALQDRVVFMAWWVDGLCSAYPQENPDHEFCKRQYEITSGTTAWPGTRLFNDKRLDRSPLAPSGEIWQRYWCNWTDEELDPIPTPCTYLGAEYP